MIIRSDVELANLSDVGCVRTSNEDFFLYVEPQEETEFQKRGRLILVADGMGGHKGGEVASALAAQTVRDIFLQTERGDASEVLAESFAEAHRAILDQAATCEELQGMGTTCAAVILKQGYASIGHVGDSRVYLLRGGRAIQMTRDHTLVGELLRAGSITEEEARHHEKRSVLTAALGSPSSSVAGDFSYPPLALESDDVLLLSSDGLHGLVGAEDLADCVYREPLSAACTSLVELAKRRGGEDNITLQLLRVREGRHDR